MSLNCGIVGLPNVGKSTLFNAITNTTNAESANYPFCTIEPNTGIVPVADGRLIELAKLANSAKIIPNTLEIVDIAGLVKGASKGEGLGNQFLGNIRQVDAILHVVRCFEDADVLHVDGNVDPTRDIEVIETELLLSDISMLQKKLDTLEKKIKSQKDASLQIEVIQELLTSMNHGNSASQINFSDVQMQEIKGSFGLITNKPIIYVCNVGEGEVQKGNAYTAKVSDLCKIKGAKHITISAKIEAELSSFSNEDKATMLEEFGIQHSGLEQVARIAFDMLGLITFFTIGPKEAHAWSIKKGSLAPQAAGVIHTDFEKGFIKAETISYKDYIELGGESGARQAGRLRLEGKEYLVQDGDVMHFKFNV